MHKISKTFCVIAVLGMMANPKGYATENGTNIYPVGVNTVLDGLAPEPGWTRVYNYTQYYEASKFAGPNGKSAVPGFHLSVAVDVPRITHTWNQTLGPFTFTSGASFTMIHADTSVLGTKGVRTGFGDMTVEPLDINYVNSNHSLFALVAPFDTVIPTGGYSLSRFANLGLNHYGFVPNAAVTWFPRPDWELSAQAALQINLRNKATDYTSGTIASLEFGVGYNVTKSVQLGIQGFYLQQVSDDKVAGQSFQNGFRGRALGIGPQIRYDFAPGYGIVLKYQREFDVRNRPEGNRLWLQVSVPIG